MFALAALPAGRQRNAFVNESEQFIAGRFAMWLLLLSLGMLFGASLIAFLVIRLQLADHWPGELISLPRGLWFSAIIMLFSSATIHAALHAARCNRKRMLVAGLAVTFVLGCLFLAMQVQCWLVALAELRNVWLELGNNRLAATGFYIFSGVHGLHVVGGLIPMAVVTLRAARNQYNAQHYGGVQYITMYWHFLDGVWIVLFATLLIGM